MDWEDALFHFEEDETLCRKMDEDLDLAIALSLQEELNEHSSEDTIKVETPITKSTGPSKKPLSIIDPQWELIDPSPDIHGLFLEFNTKFFYGKLLGVEVKWSSRMTLCAGVCCYEGRGGLCSVRLSLPLLKLRPRSDLVETLLHEMIHAYLFVTQNNKDHSAHGPEFLKHMHRINKETGTKISVYHSFHDEVDFQRQHWWKCDGPCKGRRPFFGIVKRAMNRPPGPNDTWWSQHQSSCGGKFTKIKEPVNFKQKNQKQKQILEKKDHKPLPSVQNFFQPSTSASSPIQSSNFKRKREEIDSPSIKKIFANEDNLVSVRDTDFKRLQPTKTYPTPFSGQGFTLGSSSTAPTSLLSKIRKELGHVPRQALQQNSLESIKSKITTNSSSSKLLKGNSSNLAVSQPSASTTGKGKLKQACLDMFVNSPLKSSDNKNVQGHVNQSLPNSTATVSCPVCSSLFPDSEINTHLDQCLTNF